MTTNEASKLNPVQFHLLELFSKNMTETDLIEIKKLLVAYYQKKVEQEVQTFWNKKNMTKESWNQATRDIHLRSKKNSDQ